MKKLLLVSLCFLMLSVTQVFAQNRTVTGTVTAKEDGLPLPGVSVKVRGTSTGTQTSSNGKYTLSVPPKATLEFSFIGYTSMSVPVGTKATVDVSLVQGASQLGEVVVTTAQGIKHTKNELGYAVATISAKELTQTNPISIATGLTAKVSGLAIYTLNNGVDPSISVTLRGNRSLEGNNNALIVLDGVPIPAADLNQINPNDVADVTVLKGAGAAALYGSEASNGALLITTKRGTNSGKPTITYGNSFQVEKVAYFPKLQTEFGPGAGEVIDPITGFYGYVPFENEQYGPRYDGSIVPIGTPLDSLTGFQPTTRYSPAAVNPVKGFFKTGITEQNDISYQQGDAKNSLYISAQNAYRTTVVPNDKNIRNAFSVRGHNTYGIFSIDYSAGYTKNHISTYGSNYVPQFGENTLYGAVLQLPAYLDLNTIKNPDAGLGTPDTFYDAYAVNPYWITNHTRVVTDRDVLLSNLKLTLDPTKWLTVSYRISNNYGVAQRRSTAQEVDFSPYIVTDPLGASNIQSQFKATLKSPGLVSDETQYGDGTFNNLPDAGYNRIQGDALLDFHKKFVKDNLSVDLILGNTVWEQNRKYTISGSNNLLLKDFYNISVIGGQIAAEEDNETIRQIAYFADLNLNWKHYLTLEGTFRNEQDSRLSAAERSFSYPSGKLSFIPTEVIPGLKDSKIISNWKIYGSVSRVGNIDISPYEINNIYGLAAGFPYGSLGGLQSSSTSYSPTLKPELTTEIEFGTDISFFDDRLNITADHYDQKVKNQTVNVSTSITTGYSNSILNLGETESSGYEFQVSAAVLTKQNNNFSLILSPNFSINQSKVISLLPGINQLYLGNNQYAVVGQPFPLLKTTDFVRDPKTGNVVVDASTGYPSVSPDLTTYGRTTPKYNLGLTASASYKFVTLSATAEYRGGNVIDNAIGQSLLFNGLSSVTAEAGRQVFVYPNSEIKTANGYIPNTNVTVKDGNYNFWEGSAFSKANSPVISSGAFWKLREVSLNFDLTQFINKTHFVKGLNLALTGRNLIMLVPKSNPYTDPEFSTNNPFSNVRGYNDDSLTPGTRTYGADLRVTF